MRFDQARSLLRTVYADQASISLSSITPLWVAINLPTRIRNEGAELIYASP
jgi:hypothetical protein